jgi:hypothetical protein
MHKLVEVRVMDGYRLHLLFQDGTKGIVDLGHLTGRGVFQLWNDRKEFEKVIIGPGGELRWGDEIDLCPDSLYLRVTKRNPVEAFPGLHGEAINA